MVDRLWRAARFRPLRALSARPDFLKRIVMIAILVIVGFLWAAEVDQKECRVSSSASVSTYCKNVDVVRK